MSDNDCFCVAPKCAVCTAQLRATQAELAAAKQQIQQLQKAMEFPLGWFEERADLLEQDSWVGQMARAAVDEMRAAMKPSGPQEGGT